MNRNPNHLLFIAEELSSCLPPCLQKYLMFLKESQYKYLRMQNKFYIYQFAKIKKHFANNINDISYCFYVI